MKYVFSIAIILLLTNLTLAQTGEVSPVDLRYHQVLPGTPGSQFNMTADAGNTMPVLGSIARKPGYVFLSSAVLPGLGQAANQQWWKAGLFFAVEAAAVGFYIHKENTGRSGEREYERYANENWSVVAYARWMVDTYKEGEIPAGLLNQGYEEFPDPNWGNTHEDWNVISIEGLRELEQKARYTTGHSFNHSMPDYDSQQYYELVSKYFQYAPGWEDFVDPFNGSLDVDLGYFSPKGWHHAAIGYRFNDDLNIAGHMVTLLLANHFVSAFDAYITHVLRNNRIQASASMRNGPELRLTYNF